MQNTIFFAQLLGVFALVMGASMALRKKMLLGVFRDLVRERSVSYIMGVAILLIGLLLILNHNVWTSPASRLISILGWMVTAEGVAYLFVTEKQLRSMLSWLNEDNVYYSITLGYLVIGAYLVYFGFQQ